LRNVLNINEFRNLDVMVLNKFNESDLRDLIEYCTGIRCTHSLIFSSRPSDIYYTTHAFSNESLREMM
ncbi:hypothetical protein PFISCL1PPCAC_21192, partial [Pristionchus fissidentatus]